jgi:hypothetical protein
MLLSVASGAVPLAMAQIGITVTSPVAGEIWYLGDTQTIRWTSTGITGLVQVRMDYVGLSLSLAWVDVAVGSYTFTVPANWPDRTDWHAAVTSFPNQTFGTSGYIRIMSRPATVPGSYLAGYASNLNVGDAMINITNTGALGASLQSGTAASITGSICANVYSFSPDEQLVSCCSCPVTPNGLRALSANRDLIGNILTPATPTSIVIKLLGTVPVGGNCTNSAANVLMLAQANGLVAWGTSVHSAATPPLSGQQSGPFTVTSRAFVPATLSAGELSRLSTLCNFILANGSGYGVCKSCQLGGLEADKQ